MSFIIAATDFTDTANNAVGYACMLATHYEASVIVIHSYEVPVTFDDTDMIVILEEESRRNAEKQLWKFMDNLTATFNNITVNGIVMRGGIIDSIADYTADKKPWLIVVGNSLHDEDSAFSGDNLIQLMKKLEYPVVAVPANATYRAIDKLCLSYDYNKPMDELFAGKVCELATSVEAELHVLNVENRDAAMTPDMPLISESIHEQLGTLKPQFHFVHNDDISKGVTDFVNANHIDWLIVQPQKHNLLERLFVKSETKALTRSSSVPVVSLH